MQGFGYRSIALTAVPWSPLKPSLPSLSKPSACTAGVRVLFGAWWKLNFRNTTRQATKTAAGGARCPGPMQTPAPVATISRRSVEAVTSPPMWQHHCDARRRSGLQHAGKSAVIAIEDGNTRRLGFVHKYRHRVCESNRNMVKPIKAVAQYLRKLPRQQKRGVHGVTLRAVGDLVAATGAVSNHQCIGLLAHGRQQA